MSERNNLFPKSQVEAGTLIVPLVENIVVAQNHFLKSLKPSFSYLVFSRNI